jgi:hypothetical protein
MKTELVGVMVSCRCYQQFRVPASLLKNPKKLGKHIMKIVNDGQPDDGWKPETFCDPAEVYVVDQMLDLNEDGTVKS